MLTRLSSAIAIALLATGATVVLGTAPALAGPCVMQTGHSCATHHYRQPGRPAQPGKGNNSGGKTTPIP
jgi:hypothetical protein